MLAALALLAPAAAAAQPEVFVDLQVAQAGSAGARPAWSELAVVTEVKTWTFANYTRVVVYFDRKVRWEERTLAADATADRPARIYLDLMDARLAPSVPAELPIDDGLLQRARIAQFDKQRARLVLDLKSLAAWQVVPFGDPFRLVIDVRGTQGGAPPVAAAPMPTAPSGIEDILGGKPAPVIKAPPATRSPTPGIQRPQQPPTIVIDAGHGGKDPGAIGLKGIREKDVVLNVARDVGGRLQRAGYRVIYTRADDRFLKLEERTIVANRENADLFVSIHANSAPNPKAFGIETYRLARATDKDSAAVAARENSTTGSSDGDLLDDLLTALKLTNKANESTPLAQYVQKSIVNTLSPHWKPFRSIGVKGAPFYVLVGTEMPAILIEIGFVTNPVEAKRLRDSRYLGQLAEGITGGIQEFLRTVNRTPI